MEHATRSIRWGIAVATLGCACAVPTSLARAEPPASVVVSPLVESHVQAAFFDALERLPEPLRAIHPVLRVERAAAHAVPDDAPLAVRLLGRAALMSFDRARSTIHVYDAAVTGRPHWGLPAPDRASLGSLLNDLGLGDGVVDDDGTWCATWLEQAWCSFVARIARIEGVELEPGQVALPCPPVGDVETLDRFLRAGVRVALGGLDPSDPEAMVGLFVHELGHAVQLGRVLDTHLPRWGELSGWRIGADPDRPDADRARGRLGAGIVNEHPIVLIRLILEEPPRRTTRRGVLFSARCVRCFVTPYAAYDLLEDFAEAVRLMDADPGALATTSPEKFLFVNAVDFNATMDHRTPSRLWRPATELASAPWRDALVAAIASLLDADDLAPDGPRLDARTITALLRAHAELPAADELPTPHAFPPIPDDLPRAIFDGAARADLAVIVDGIEHLPPPAHVIDVWDRALLMLADMVELERLLMPRFHTAEEARETYERVAALGDPEERWRRFSIILPALRDALDDTAFTSLVQREVDHAVSIDRAAAGLRLAFEAGSPWLNLRSGAGDLERIRRPTGTPYDLLEWTVAQTTQATDIFATLAREHPDRAARVLLSAIGVIEGAIPPTDPAGLGHRASLFISVAEVARELESNGGVDGEGFEALRARLAAAIERELRHMSWPRSRARLEQRAARALGAP